MNNKPFWALFGTQFFGGFNDNFFRSAFITLVTYHLVMYTPTQKSLFVSAAFGLLTLPFFLFSPLAGQLCDRYDKAFLIRLVKVSETLIVGVSAYGFIHHDPYFLLGSLFFMGTHSSFFGPAKYSILPDILPKNKLLGGNGLIEAGTFFAILGGTLCGALMIHLNLSMFLLCLTLLFVAILGLGMSCLIPPITPRAPHLKMRLSWAGEMKRLIRYSRVNHRVFQSIVGISWFWLVGTVLLSQLPPLAKEVLKVDESIYIFLTLLVTVGIGVGSVLCNWLFKGEITTKYIPHVSLLMILILFDLSTFSQPMAARTFSQFVTSFQGIRLMLDVMALAFLGGVYIVPMNTFIQTHVIPSRLSQVIAFNNILNAGFMVFASFSIFLLSSLSVQIPTFFILSALGQVLMTLYLIPILPDAVLRKGFKGVLRLCFRFEVKGLENYKKAGEKVIFIANHVSYIDALLIAVALPEKPLFAINLYTAKRWWVKPFLVLAKVIPIDPLSPYSLREAIEEAKKGHRVLIFPEGRVTLTGGLMKIYEGPGLVAERAGAQVLPIRIEGAQYTVFSRLKKGEVPRRLFPKITLTLLPPQSFTIDPALKGRARRKALGETLYDKMTRMMFETSAVDKTLFAAFIESAKLYGRRTPILEDVSLKTLTYGALFSKVFALSRFFKRNTQEGETVGLMLPNTHGLVVSFWALQAIDRVPALLNYTGGFKTLLNACQVAQITQVYTSRDFVEKLRLQEAIHHLERHKIHIHYLEDVRKKVGFFSKLWGVYGMFFPQGVYTPKRLPSEGCVVLFTSGSEGTPKGVVLSHQNLQANRYQLSSVIDFNQNDYIFNVLPLFHAFGLTAGMILPLLSGIRAFHYISPLHYRAVAELIYDRGATILFGTDTFLSGYGRVAHTYDFHTLRYIFAGAEKLKKETQTLWFEKFGLRLFEGYGTTETGPVLCVNTPMHYKAGTVGRFLPDIAYRFEPVEGVTHGGRLWVKGPNVMKGYLLSTKPGKLVPPPEGWYDTADVAVMDEEGYVRLLGRAKRFAKVGGEMVSLAAVEEAVYRVWPEAKHAVIAQPDPKKGERLILFTDYPSADKSALISFWKAQGMAELTLPASLYILSSLPLLGTGKVDYKALEENKISHPSKK